MLVVQLSAETCTFSSLYFRRRQAPHTPPHDAPVRSISWCVPIGVSVLKRRSKSINARAFKALQKLSDFQDTV